MQRVGVFVCWCGSNIAGTVDVAAVSEALKSEPGVVFSANSKNFAFGHFFHNMRYVLAKAWCASSMTTKSGLNRKVESIRLATVWIDSTLISPKVPNISTFSRICEISSLRCATISTLPEKPDTILASTCVFPVPVGICTITLRQCFHASCCYQRPH